MAGNLHNQLNLLAMLIFVVANTVFADDSDPYVEVNGAIITGKTITITPNVAYEADEYLGIRYANQPQRFAKAELREPQRGDRIEATKLPNSCPQVNFTNFDGGKFQGEAMWNPNTDLSEDCLFLNIWTPRQMFELRNEFPVLIWIYGGGFIAGTSTLDLYNGVNLASSRDVVVVSINYRVNVFGFLYFNSPNAPGNMGLWDQQLALQWVKKHIRAFGGDPDKITIFGESAGAASVNMHLLSSHSQSYFKNAIMQSASALAPWATRSPEIMLKRSQDFARYMDCTGTDENMIACLRGKPIKQILDKQATDWFGYGGLNEWDFNDFGWVPVIDGDFLRDTPENLVKQLGKDFRKNVLVGVNRDEGIYFVVYANTTLFDPTQLYTGRRTSFIDSENFKPFFTSLLPSSYKRNAVLKESIFKFYEDEMNAPDSESNILTPSGQRQYPNKMQYALDRMVGDLHFVCPVNEFADVYSDRTSGSTYYYYFNHRSSVQTWPEWMGVLHGYEINFIFAETWKERSELRKIYSGREYSRTEQDLSNDMMEGWSSFAMADSPSWYNRMHWPPYNSRRRVFGEFSAETASTGFLAKLGSNRRQPQCEFWRLMVKLLQEMKSACAIWRSCTKGNGECKSAFITYLIENTDTAGGRYNWVISNMRQPSFDQGYLCPRD